MNNPALHLRLPKNTPLVIPIYVGNGLLEKLPALLQAHLPAYRYALITDSNVEKLYGEKLLTLLNSSGLCTELFSFPAGESSKNEDVKKDLDHALLKKGFGRDSAILALGGGVVGDLAGFVAATYLRGIPFAQIPTTVLGMVDSSIGGKVGIDTPYGKNLIGAFWQPGLIVADLNTLSTLPPDQIQNGWFEALKMFVTLDRETYNKFLENPSNDFIQRAMELKIGIIEQDEKESNLRSILNFGHTVGHALELLSNYKLLHGFAVGLGMIVEAQVAVNSGNFSVKDFEIFTESLKSIGLDFSLLKKYDFEDVWEAVQNDKKNREGQVKIIILGKNILHPIKKIELQKAWEKCLKL